MCVKTAFELIDLDSPGPKTPSDCPVEGWLAFLGHRWNALVLWHLKDGSKRYSDLVGFLPGISSKVLTERLASLEKRGLLVRAPVAAFPRSVVYSLSKAGIDLVRILDQLELWSRRSLAKVEPPIVEDRDCARRVD